jgi:PBSX family phage terminase large subunit
LTTSPPNSLTSAIAPAFYALHHDIKSGGHSTYKLSGGRGSTKSSFVSVEIILGIMRDAQAGKHTGAVVFRRHKQNLHDSVFNQLVWAIDKLGVPHLWRENLSPLKLTFIPTGQVILFRGADVAEKAKSIKVSRGYIKYLWFEELNEFEGSEKIRNIRQSVVRGGEDFTVFYSYNPPRSQRSWVNDPQEFTAPDMLSHHSTYLEVPPDWLGPLFIAEAERLSKKRPELYRHEYLGEIVGTGSEVFTNLTARKITDEEIKIFDRIRRGIDWGYSIDPFHYTVCHYDRKHKQLLIFHEIHRIRLSNARAAELVKLENKSNTEIICDSAEPKSIADFRDSGLRIRGAKKGPDSVEYGVKWLSEELEEIIIDPGRCPNTWREFYGYELERDANGNLMARYPDKNNHSIDAVRYALELDMRRPTFSFA